MFDLPAALLRLNLDMGLCSLKIKRNQRRARVLAGRRVAKSLSARTRARRLGGA